MKKAKPRKPLQVEQEEFSKLSDEEKVQKTLDLFWRMFTVIMQNPPTRQRLMKDLEAAFRLAIKEPTSESDKQPSAKEDRTIQ